MKQLFYFSSDWCVPCQTFSPVMDQVSQKIPLRKINVDYEPDVISKYRVQSIPTVILVENEQEIRRFTGARSLQQVLEFIK
jgi:thioredoxin-like negative regulator of GroEL